MSIPKRFILWSGDGPLEAVDQVAADIASHIDVAILECESTDTCWLNEVVAYMCCLSAVAQSYGGLTSEYARVEGWRAKVLEIHDRAWEREPRTNEFVEERSYIESVLDALFESVDRSTTEKQRQPWVKCQQYAGSNPSDRSA